MARWLASAGPAGAPCSPAAQLSEGPALAIVARGFQMGTEQHAATPVPRPGGPGAATLALALAVFIGIALAPQIFNDGDTGWNAGTTTTTARR